ncbi:phosphomannomutase/phosphoglucomutase [Actinopolymorpha alba]|uniref:phosphomannomutase/phosphoglucomutase n=1 Tax=Actinopolymorpha alba TaxID=533267 RepID=UPI00036F4889|nr:phosphomannomutase/phosphoglucomutase [Actinopolymorpha alba]
MPDPRAVFKAYDIRGVVPTQLDAGLARAVGAAFVEVLDSPRAVVVGRDMRVSSPELAAAFADGVTSRGANVVDIGLASTDELYFASGHLNLPGAMITASHNPQEYGGIKLCRAGAAPIGRDTGLGALQALVEQGQLTAASRPEQPGAVERQDLLKAYSAHLRSLVDLSGVRRLTVVVDAGNGMAGLTAPAVFGELNVELVPLYFDLDGTFPHHEANPIEPANLRDLQAKVREVGADMGLAFDGDADRCWVIDERAESVSPSAITALIAVRELAREPGARVIHNLITSRAVPEVVREHGGTPVRDRVGHSFIKATMARTGAIFGGEHSAHFYFRDFWRADSGMLAALHALAALGSQEKPLSEMLAAFDRYASSGEINSTVDDQAAALDRIRTAYAGQEGVSVDELDGLTIEHADWWFNLRPSNTEPVLRLNAEAADRRTMERVRDEVLSLVQAG